MAADGVSIALVGDKIVLMVELYPSAFILALDVAQALKLSESLEEMAIDASNGGGNRGRGDLLSELLKGKKPEGNQ